MSDFGHCAGFESAVTGLDASYMQRMQSVQESERAVRG